MKVCILELLVVVDWVRSCISCIPRVVLLVDRLDPAMVNTTISILGVFQQAIFLMDVVVVAV